MTDDTTTKEAAGRSILDQVKARRSSQAAETTVELPISGWGGTVVARYRLLDPLNELQDILDRCRRAFPGNQEAQGFWGGVDVMIAACEGLYAVDETDGDLKPLSLNGSGEPATYTVDLAAALGETADSAREVVVGLFKGNKMAVGAHSGKLIQRMMDPEGVLRLGEP